MHCNIKVYNDTPAVINQCLLVLLLFGFDIESLFFCLFQIPKCLRQNRGLPSHDSSDFPEMWTDMITHHPLNKQL